MRLSGTHSFSRDWRRRSLWEHKCCRWRKHAATSPWCDAQAVAHERENTQTHPPSCEALQSVNFCCFCTARSSLKQLFFLLSLTNLICFRLKPSDYLLRQLASQPKMKCGEKDCSWGDRSEAIMTNEDVSFFFPSLSWRLSSLWLHLLECVRWREDGGHEKVNGREIAVVPKRKGKRRKLSPFPQKKTPLRCILVTISHDQWMKKKQRDISKRHEETAGSGQRQPPGVSAHACNHDDMNMFISLYCVENPQESPQTPPHHINVKTKSPLKTGSAGAREQHCWLIKS